MKEPLETGKLNTLISLIEGCLVEKQPTFALLSEQYNNNNVLKYFYPSFENYYGSCSGAQQHYLIPFQQ